MTTTSPTRQRTAIATRIRRVGDCPHRPEGSARTSTVSVGVDVTAVAPFSGYCNNPSLLLTRCGTSSDRQPANSVAIGR